MVIMKRMCRENPGWRRQRWAWEELVLHIKIVSDPTKLAQLNAELERRKRKEQEKSLVCCARITQKHGGDL
jgi:hypothetical protein